MSRYWLALVLSLAAAPLAAQNVGGPGNPPYLGPSTEVVTDTNSGLAWFTLRSGGYVVDITGQYNTGQSYTFMSRTGTPDAPGRWITTNWINGGLVDTDVTKPSSDIDFVFLSKGDANVVGVQGEYYGQPSTFMAWPAIALGRPLNPWGHFYMIEVPCPASAPVAASACIRVNEGYVPIYR